MGLKPTIYKFRIDLSDLNRNFYETLNLTIARHPSETLERMMTRVIAFCINASDRLEFSKGISSPEEPDIWSRTMDNRISLWIDVGEPSSDRVKKAIRQAANVRVYCFNSKADVWWKQNRKRLSELPLSVFQFPWEAIQTLTCLAKRTLDLSVTITDQMVYLNTEDGDCEVSWESLWEGAE